MAGEERYIEERDRTYYIRGHRIPLRSLIYLWQNGADPESMQRNFDSLTLTEVYGAITFYLEHREELDAQFEQQWAEEQALVDQARANPSPFMLELQRRFAAIQAQQKASAS
jgi:uncharacterized protein (DUF433 family)